MTYFLQVHTVHNDPHPSVSVMEGENLSTLSKMALPSSREVKANTLSLTFGKSRSGVMPKMADKGFDSI